jgi:hypothetical protein
LARTSHRIWRLAPMLAALCLAAGCGAAPPVAIPSASPSPTASPTMIAPGVRVPGSEVQIPPYAVSTTHPLPSGVSAATVAQDVVIDNLIENVAIERGDPTLLPYADCGNWLAAEEQEMGQAKGRGEVFLSVRDAFIQVEIGFQPDPSDPSASAAAILTGTETQRVRSSTGAVTVKTSYFSVIRWLVWSPTVDRYLTCDLGSS